MKKRYPFLAKTWLRFGLAATFSASLTLNLQAQTAPAIQWDKTFRGTVNDLLYSLQQTTDGGYILGGQSTSGIGGDKTEANKGLYYTTDYWVIKTDAAGNKLWDRTIGGNKEDQLVCLQQTTDGGYILGGFSNSDIGGDKSQPNKGTSTSCDYWVVKLDASGNKLWDKTFGGASWDELRSLQQTADGGYILGGFSGSGIGGDKSQAPKGGDDFWILKLDAAGNKIWDKTIGGTNGSRLKHLKQTSDGGYLLGGTSGSGIGGDKSQACRGVLDYWVVKTDAAGNKVWDKTFGGSATDELGSLQQTTDGGYIIGGTSESGISGDKSQSYYGSQGLQDYWLVKTDGNGNKLWDKTIGGNAHDTFASLQQTADGGYIVGGTSHSGISGDKSEAPYGLNDFWIVKLKASGAILWDKIYGRSSNEVLFALQQTTNGGYILGGFTDYVNKYRQGLLDYWIVKVDTSPTGMQETEVGSAISISPNPSQGKFTLKLSNLTFTTATVTVSDLLGRVVLQKDIPVTTNQLSEELTIPNTKGIYLLQLKTGEQTLTRKIVVE
jgi:hypothetical protein